MGRGRLEAFSDGVIAILVTIMVLDLRPPAGHSFAALQPLLSRLLVYLLSFTFLAIYWNNHHHLMQLVERIDGRVMWANMALLFCLSLTPAATSWLGPHADDMAPVAVYGAVQLGAAIGYFLLTRALLATHPRASRLAAAIGADRKGKLSAVAYAVAVGVAFVAPVAALAIYVAVAIVWIVPDPRVTRIASQARSADE